MGSKSGYENFNLEGDCFLLFKDISEVVYQIQFNFDRMEYVLYCRVDDNYIEVDKKSIDELEKGKWVYKDMIVLEYKGWNVYQKIRPLKLLDSYKNKKIIIGSQFVEFKDRHNGFVIQLKNFKVMPVSRISIYIFKDGDNFWLVKKINKGQRFISQ